MTTLDFVAQLEADLAWRIDEMNALKGAISSASPIPADVLRKSAVLVLYSHLEGFCVFALRHYVDAVNRAQIACRDAVPAVLAGAWENLFNAVLHGDKKCDIFTRQLPDDRGLHSHWRRRHFVEEIRTFEAATVRIDEDAVDAESNLKPLVLQRNLFVLGLDHSFVTPHAPVLHRLLAKRNSIAHGTERRGIAMADYDNYEQAAHLVCRGLIDLLEVSHREKRYQKTGP